MGQFSHVLPVVPLHPSVSVMVIVWWDLCVMAFVPPPLHPVIDRMKRDALKGFL